MEEEMVWDDELGYDVPMSDWRARNLPVEPAVQPSAPKKSGPSEWEQGWQQFLSERGLVRDEIDLETYDALLEEYSGSLREKDAFKARTKDERAQLARFKGEIASVDKKLEALWPEGRTAENPQFEDLMAQKVVATVHAREIEERLPYVGRDDAALQSELEDARIASEELQEQIGKFRPESARRARAERALNEKREKAARLEIELENRARVREVDELKQWHIEERAKKALVAEAEAQTAAHIEKLKQWGAAEWQIAKAKEELKVIKSGGYDPKALEQHKAKEAAAFEKETEAYFLDEARTGRLGQ